MRIAAAQLQSLSRELLHLLQSHPEGRRKSPLLFPAHEAKGSGSRAQLAATLAVAAVSAPEPARRTCGGDGSAPSLDAGEPAALPPAAGPTATGCLNPRRTCVNRRARPCGTAGSRQRSDSTSPRTLPGAEVNRCGHDPKHRAWPLLRWPEGGAGALASVGTRRVCLGVVASLGPDGVRGRGSRSGGGSEATRAVPPSSPGARRGGAAAARLRATTRLLSGEADRPARLTRVGQRLPAVATREMSCGLFPASSVERGPRRLSPAFITFCNFCTGSPRPQKGVGGKGLRARRSRPRCEKEQR
ncbi:unnamed protein product [Rangifer tarandus platyrhynchus]|uniref:Uncharacterized protein n=1 Tax=Rangifer tarandus platyrhynchus TaxID=3082113 RepID=A0ABN8Y2J5_RANTA|nr:unnamed protein product [Rangifer tarandus platyrhynchus]